MRNVWIAGKEYTIQGKLPSGAVVLTGARGGELLARPFSNNPAYMQIIRMSRRSLLSSPLTDAYGQQIIVAAADLD